MKKEHSNKKDERLNEKQAPKDSQPPPPTNKMVETEDEDSEDGEPPEQDENVETFNAETSLSEEK